MAEEKIKIEEGETMPAEEKEILKPKKKKKSKKKVDAISEFMEKKPAHPVEKKKQDKITIEEEIIAEIPQESEKVLKIKEKTDESVIEVESKKEEIAADPMAVADSQEENKDKRKKILKISLITFGVIMVLGLLGASGYFYYKYKTVSKGNGAAEQGVEYYVSKIGKFIILPEGEEPTLATVTDVEKLKDQPFFAQARNEDKVLLYAQAQKAILYRPSENKIVEMATTGGNGALQSKQETESAPPAGQQSSTSTENQATEAPKTASVAIYNGTDIKGLAKIVGSKVEAIEGITVSEKTNAKETYSKTIIIDLSGSRGTFVKSIIEKIGGEAGNLPEGETKPDADILIISGSDANVN